MKPSPFSYVAARTKEEALDLLQAGAGEAKILAGGQSLMPLMNFRLVRPSVLVDINRISELAGIALTGSGVRIGALTRHAQIEMSEVLAGHFPVLTAGISHVAHLAIRNRGTIGGSLAYADPAAELPMLMRLLDARLTVISATAHRTISTDTFFVSALTTDLAAEEILTEIEIPFLHPRTGWGFRELARRHGDFALAAVAVTLHRVDRLAGDVRIAVTGVGETPIRPKAAEKLLEGQTLDPEVLGAVVNTLRDTVAPNSDLHASADYRRHLVGVLAARAIADAWQRAEGSFA